MTTHLSISDLIDQMVECDAKGDSQGCIALCERILECLDREKIPDLWASIQGVLADHLRKTPGDPANGPERAIHHYLQALEGLRQDGNAKQWASNHGNLGNLYLERKQGNRADNLNHAIEHFKAALRVFDLQPDTMDWAATQASLGEAYAALDGHPLEVIKHFEAALTLIKRADRPKRWLLAKIALSDAYAALGNDQMVQAVSCLQEAISAVSPNHHMEYGYLNEKLGHYSPKSPMGGTPQAMERTIRAFETALSAYQAGGIRDGEIRVRGQLGHSYAHRRFGDRADNLKKAIAHLETVVAHSNEKDPAWGYVNAALARLYEDPALR